MAETKEPEVKAMAEAISSESKPVDEKPVAEAPKPSVEDQPHVKAALAARRADAHREPQRY